MDARLRIRRWIGAWALGVSLGASSFAMADHTCPEKVPFNPHPPIGVAALNDNPKIPFLSVSTHTDFSQRQVLDLADGLWVSWKSNAGHRIVEANDLFCGPNCYFDVPAGKAVNTLIVWANQAGLAARFWEQVFATTFTRPVKGCYPPLEALRAMFADTQLGKTGVIPDLVYSDITNRGDVGLYYFDVIAGNATSTLTELANQAKLQMLYDYAKVVGKKTVAVHGFYTFGAAFRSMVPDGSLRYEFVNERTLSITGTPRTSQISPNESSMQRWLARLQHGKPVGTPASMSEVVIAAEREREAVPAPGEPILSYGRPEFESAGAFNVPDVLQTIPQVFAGGPNEYTQIGREASTNSTKGVGFNLRGLDAGDALVLIDGQRLAGSGTAAEYADVSMIPLGAIERIDIIADGPSLKYGSDAVAGVVNFVTRDDFSGAETQARYGMASGAVGERQVSQLFGSKWDGGHAMLEFEYYERDALPSSERGQATSDLTRWGGGNWGIPLGYPGNIYVGSQVWPVQSVVNGKPVLGSAGSPKLYDWWSGQDILPWQKRLSVVGSAAFTMGDAELWSDFWLSTRHSTLAVSSGALAAISLPSTNPGYVNPAGGTDPVTLLYGLDKALGPVKSDFNVLSGNTVIGVRWSASGWLLEGSLSAAWERARQLSGNEVDQNALQQAVDATQASQLFNPFDPQANTAIIPALRTNLYYESHSKLRTVSMSASRNLFKVFGGDAELLIGAQYRHDALTSYAPPLAPEQVWQSRERGIASSYGQFNIPLTTTVNLAAGARFEHYEGAQSLVSPKVSVSWEVGPPVVLRGSFGKSFRPPALTDVTTSSNFSEIVTLPSGQTALGVVGGNPDLNPEIATTWTGGVDIATGTGLAFSATYFNVSSHDRVVKPQFSYDVATFDGVLIKNPTAAQRESICSQSLFLSGSVATCDNTSVAYLIDARLQNLDVLHTSGVDLTGKYEVKGWDFRVDGTYLFKYSEMNLNGSPTDLSSVLNTPGYPTDFRGRASMSKSIGNVVATVAVNYTDSYRDPGNNPPRRVASWTTFDLALVYHPVTNSWLRGTDFSLGARNLLNRGPPFVNDGAVQGGWDPANGGNLMGRVVMGSIRASW